MDKGFTLNVENKNAALFSGKTDKLAAGALTVRHQSAGLQITRSLRTYATCIPNLFLPSVRGASVATVSPKLEGLVVLILTVPLLPVDA